MAARAGEYITLPVFHRCGCDRADERTTETQKHSNGRYMQRETDRVWVQVAYQFILTQNIGLWLLVRGR